MTQTRSSTRARLILGFLTLLAISILPSVARAQNCGDQGSPPVQVSVSVSPGSIIGWSGVTTLTETLNCTVASNSSIAWGAGSEINGGGLVQQADPANPCQCIPAGSSSGTIQLYGTQVSAAATFTITVAYGTAQAQTNLTVNPLVAAISISPSSIVGGSNQTAIASFTLNAPVIQAAGIEVGCTNSGCSGYSVQIPAGGTACTPPQVPPRPSDCVTLSEAQVAQSTTLNFVAFYQYSAPETTATLTVTPNIPTVTVSPGTIVGGLSQNLTATWTLPAPAGPSGGTEYLYVFYPPPGQSEFFGTSVSVNSGQNNGQIQFPDPGPVTINSTFTVQTCYIYSQDCSTTTFSVTPPPPVIHPADEGPAECKLGCASPINISNGNTWIQERDYSLPGLGGGLELTRTWNSHWQDASPVSVLGMFGHSWRSTYEERFSFPDGNTVMYWRADGAGWTFTYNSATQTYSLASPLNEHAALTYNSVAGQYTLAFADGSQRIFSQPGYLTAIIDRNGNQTTVNYDGSNRITQVIPPSGTGQDRRSLSATTIR